MPPRFAYWTILVGGLPTAFRATERAELLPTFKRLQEKHPDAAMQWFARGKLWDSPEAAREALVRAREGDRPRDRGRDWRPGGEHRDPRQKYIDAKKERNLDRRKQRFERRERGPERPPEDSRPAAARTRPTGPAAWTPRGQKPSGPGEWKPRGPKPAAPGGWKPRGPKPAAPAGWKPPGPGQKPGFKRPDGAKRPDSAARQRPDRPRGPRPPRGPRGPKR